MIVETPLNFDWNKAMAKLATLPRQAEWEEYVAISAVCRGSHIGREWQMMERMFYLYE